MTRRRKRLAEVRERYRDDALQRGFNPRDVDLLLSDILGKPLSFLIAHGDEKIDPAPLAALLKRRFAGEPLQYIRRKTEFFSREFYVDDRVLIPRPETEVLVETALARAPRNGRVIDIGTGSGCIAISIERTRPDLRVTGVDVSLAALAVADRNRRALGSRVRLAGSDLLASVHGEFDLIVSNPPYVREEELAQLEPEVRLYEPRLALTSGPRGTEIIEKILDQVSRGTLLMEVGYGQEAAIRALAKEKRFKVEAFVNYLAGIPRVVVLQSIPSGARDLPRRGDESAS